MNRQFWFSLSHSPFFILMCSHLLWCAACGVRAFSFFLSTDQLNPINISLENKRFTHKYNHTQQHMLKIMISIWNLHQFQPMNGRMNTQKFHFVSRTIDFEWWNGLASTSTHILELLRRRNNRSMVKYSMCTSVWLCECVFRKTEKLCSNLMS